MCAAKTPFRSTFAGKGKREKPALKKPPVPRRVNIAKDPAATKTAAVEPTPTSAPTLPLAGESGGAAPDAATSARAAHGATSPDSAKPAKKDKAPKAVKPAKEPKAPKSVKEKKAKRVSALDAAATVLRAVGAPMRAVDIIQQMEERGLWKSPGGKTPASTLYAAMTREITQKGDGSRFHKGDKGLFAAAPARKGD